MYVNKRAAWLALALVLFFMSLACQASDRILTIAQANTATPTRTRTVRPTFTPQPTVTFTPQPTATPIPPTRTATRRPTAKPTVPPPPPPVAAPQPTKPQFQFRADSFRCEHSGGSWLKGSVYGSNNPDDKVPGIGVVFGGAGGDIYDGPNLTDGNGDFAFVLSPDNTPARLGTYYIWLVDNSKNRISTMAGPIIINGKNETFVDSCWAGWAFFIRN